MKPTDDDQRPTAGELMGDDELERPTQERGFISPEEAADLARKHQEGIAEGRARVGEGDPNAGLFTHDPKGTTHPGKG